jgi:hypothetical protein
MTKTKNRPHLNNYCHDDYYHLNDFFLHQCSPDYLSSTSISNEEETEDHGVVTNINITTPSNDLATETNIEMAPSSEDGIVSLADFTISNKIISFDFDTNQRIENEEDVCSDADWDDLSLHKKDGDIDSVSVISHDDNDDEWDNVSSIHSIISVDTFSNTYTYSEALRKKMQDDHTSTSDKNKS